MTGHVHDQTVLHVDPHRPGIAAGDIRCPTCHQTYTQIIDDRHNTPIWHYPQPTVPKSGGPARIAGRGFQPPPPPRSCPTSGDELNRQLFLAQLAAQQEAAA